MNKVINDSGYVFEVVDEFPDGYEIWAIGREHFDLESYVPLCEVDKDYSVNTDTLKCLKVRNEDLALILLNEAVRVGVNKDKFNIIEREI